MNDRYFNLHDRRHSSTNTTLFDTVMPMKRLFFFLLCSTLCSIIQARNEYCGPSPDSSGIRVSDGGALVQVWPTGRPRVDHWRLTKAIARANIGGTVWLCEGTFNMGSNFGNRHTVVIRKALTLEGVYIDQEWQTIVKGGGDGLRPYFPDSVMGPVHIATVLGAVTIDGLWFRDWINKAVYVASVDGFTFTNSKLSHPRIAKNRGFPFGFVDYVHGIIATGRASRGSFVITNNVFDITFGDDTNFRPNDAQPCCLYGFPPTRFDNIQIEDNIIVTENEGLELLGNLPLKQSSIYIRNNTIDMSYKLKGWPDTYAILAGGNAHTSEFVIEDNVLTLNNGFYSNPEDFADVGVISLTGENFRVRNNRIEVQDFDGRIFRFGNALFGHSITDSVFEDNEIVGSYKGIGVDFTGGQLNKSRRNVFRLGTSLAAASVGSTTIRASGARVCGNTWEGDLGTVEGDLDAVCRL
jgi:hypothetical protein